MTATQLNEEFAKHARIFKRMLDDGTIDVVLFNKLMEKVKEDTFFALEVLETIEAL